MDLERSLSCLRRIPHAALRSFWQAALFWAGTLLLAGCVGTILTPAAQPAAPWPELGHEVAYDFVTPPDQILSSSWLNNKTTSGDEHCSLGKDVRQKKGV
jgi:hypothetical protein